MEEIPGKREGSSRYVHDGYEYHIDTTSVTIYRCATRATTGCRGAIHVLDGDLVNVYQPHDVDHPQNFNIVVQSEMRREMLERARLTHVPFKQMFEDVCRRNHVVGREFSFPTMRNAMKRARDKVRPPIPEDLRSLAVHLDTYGPTQGLYRGLVEGSDGSVALVFSSDALLAELSTREELYVDGTFKVAPSHPRVAQLYTIHMRIKACGIAAFFVLCSARTAPLYCAIFERLTQLAPGITENVRFLMGDYERAAMKALRRVFPRASLHGCWFHFSQALLRRWRHLGLFRAPTEILRMAMVLPLAPAERFEEGLGILATKADALEVNHPAVLRFMSYLRRQWGPLSDVVSVHGCPSRTNNNVESFHNEAKRILGGLHPNIWLFIGMSSSMLIGYILAY